MTMNSLSSSSNQLGFNLYRTLPKQGNVAISPASISTALTMTWSGARGDTAAEMARVLNIDVSPETTMTEYARIIAGMISEATTHGIELAISNRLFGEKSLVFNEDFTKNLFEAFGAGLSEVDFINDAEGARNSVNSWCAASTKNRIKEILAPGSVDNTTRLIVGNALYLLAPWKDAFLPSKTYQSTFKSGGELYPCKLMNQSGQYKFLKTNNSSIVEIPYTGNGMSMIIVLPTLIDGLSEVEDDLTANLLMDLHRKMQPQKVDIRLPKFTIDPSSPLALKQQLQHLGMHTAFDYNTANFSGILDSNEKIEISNVYHKTFVKVTEAGTEMAAVTAIAMARSVSMNPVFHADHPFFWAVIDHSSQLILGMGRVTETTDAE